MRDNYQPAGFTGLFRPEKLWYRSFHPTPKGDGFFAMEPVGAERRNEVAAATTLAVGAGAASGSSIGPAALQLNADADLPRTLLVLIWNGSDAAISLTFQIPWQSSWLDVQGGQNVAVAAGKGLAFMVEGLGFGDGAPQVVGSLTSAATNGGSVNVELRYV